MTPSTQDGRIRIGPAGWSYKDWAGVVYPAPKPRGFDPLSYVAGYFDTVEINSTFYRPAPARNAHSWLDRVEGNPSFRFTVKLWKRFTHERKEAWGAGEVKEARAVLDTLQTGERLGAVLVQFPWSFRRTDENREWLDDVTRAFDDFSLVLEVRHASWNTPEFYHELTDRGIGFVNIDQPLFHDSIKPSARATSPVGYVRVHGRNYKEWFREGAGVEARYDYLYSADELRPWAERATEIAAAPQTQEVYVVTNNHFRGKAAANALMLRSMLEERSVPAPPALWEEYQSELGGYAEPEERLPT